MYRVGLSVGLVFFVAIGVWAAEGGTITAEQLLDCGRGLVDRTHYLEALDLLQEACDKLEHDKNTQSELYADTLFNLAQAKIKGRIHQRFPAYYVKTALENVKRANKLLERVSGVLPQKLSAGYFLEGYIHWNFFRRKPQAVSCFVKAVNVDTGNAAAKRALSELITGDDGK